MDIVQQCRMYNTVNESPLIFWKAKKWCDMWNWKGIIFSKLLPKNDWFNQVLLLSIPPNEKKLVFRINRKGIIFNQDNSRLHVYLVTKKEKNFYTLIFKSLLNFLKRKLFLWKIVNGNTSSFFYSERRKCKVTCKIDGE